MTDGPGAYPNRRGGPSTTPLTRAAEHTSAGALPLGLELPEHAISVLAKRVADVLEARDQAAAATSPWLDAAEAAEYLRCGRQRVYDLVSGGRLRVAKDGSRSLFRRAWLDAYLDPPAAGDEDVP